MAQRWVDQSRVQSGFMQKLPPSQREKAKRRGYLAKTEMAAETMGGDETTRISDRDLYYAQPLSGIYGKWLADHVTARRIFHSHSDLFQPLRYHAFSRSTETLVVEHDVKPPHNRRFAERPAVILEGVPLWASPAVWGDTDTFNEGTVLVDVEDGEVLVGESRMDVDGFERWVHANAQGKGLVFLAAPTGHVNESSNRLEVLLVRGPDSKAKVTDAFVTDRNLKKSTRLKIDGGLPVEAFMQGNDGRCEEAVLGTPPITPEQWRVLVDSLENALNAAPVLTFAAVEMTLGEQPRILRINGYPDLPPCVRVSETAAKFVEGAVAAKNAAWAPPAKRLQRLARISRLHIRKLFAQSIYPQGLVPYQSTRWPADIVRDFVASNGVPFKDKLWAYKNGFLSYRLPQYGITRANREKFISDFDYRWVRHINNPFRTWFEDKLTLKYLYPDRGELFPDYYFHVSGLGDGSEVFKLQDCPDDLPSSVEGVIELAERLGDIAVKPEEGSHGEGFFRLQSVDGTLMRNGEPTSRAALRKLFSERGQAFIISEFIASHDELSKFYPDAVSTIRMFVYKPDGRTSKLGNVYLRLGTASSGHVDNLAAGGMVALIDEESGHFHTGGTLRSGELVSLSHHPNTGLLVEGVIPSWDRIREAVLELSDGTPELEYLGFDVAVTQDGFKVIEVNRAPDYPRVVPFTPDMVEYLKQRVVAKKEGLEEVRRPRISAGLREGE